jgi:hypothetical protein
MFIFSWTCLDIVGGVSVSPAFGFGWEVVDSCLHVERRLWMVD